MPPTEMYMRKKYYLCRRSKDLVNWEFVGMTMNEVPNWIKNSLNSMRLQVGLLPIDDPKYGFWAPVVRKTGSVYRMYYSVIVDSYIITGKPNTPVSFGGLWTEKAFIGMMETSDLSSNTWQDKGYVISSSSDKGTDWKRNDLNDWDGYFKWNVVDPSFIVTPEGEHWLIYGSWRSGITAVKLDSDTGKPLNNLGNPLDVNKTSEYGKLIARRENSNLNRWQVLEAPEIIFNEKTGCYYLFFANDELSVAYNTRVCRSKNIDGPYFEYKGTNISAGNHSSLQIQ